MTIKRKNHGRGHSYYDGQTKLDGVTTLLGQGVPKPALVSWAGRTVAEFVVDRIQRRGDELVLDDTFLADLAKMNAASQYPQKWDGVSFSRTTIAKILGGVMYGERDAAANRGTEVHALGERLAHGEEVEVPPELEGHVDSYVKFLDEWNPRIVATELVVVNRQWSYAGQLDLIADFPPPYGCCLADIKTSRSGIWPETSLQLAAYAGAEAYLSDDGEEHPMSELGIERALAVWIRSDGYDVKPVQIGDRVHRDFLHSAWIARWFKRNEDLVGPSLRAPAPWPDEDVQPVPESADPQLEADVDAIEKAAS